MFRKKIIFIIYLKKLFLNHPRKNGQKNAFG
jgi:hypothetical protein